MKKYLLLIGVVLVVVAAFLVASAPAASAQAPAQPAAAPAATLEPETCAICHKNSGATHQTYYDQLYQDGVIKVTDVKYSFTAPDTTVITFKMTKNGAPFSGKDADSLNIYFVPYDGKNFQFADGGPRLSLKGKLTFDGTTTTSTLVGLKPGDTGYIKYTDVSAVNGVIVVYGYDELMGRLPERVYQNKYPFVALQPTGKGVDYVSAASNAGCVKCHTDPYLKHGNIYAQVGKDPKTDFITCKVCHLDNGAGGHFEWQLLADAPDKGANYLAGTYKLTEAETAKYAYKTTLMNDVHMSHAMEFPYPQSMAACATCHEGKLDKVLADANFKYDTCRSCHPQTGSKGASFDTTKLALATIIPPDIHKSLGADLAKADCAMCHKTGGAAKTFKQIHTGYDQTIYTAEGVKYSTVITVSVDKAAFDKDKNVLTIDFSAHQDKAPAELKTATITPTVLVGLYGWDTKDFIIGPHERLIDDNKDGKFDSKDSRNLESVIGADDKNPRIKVVSAAGGKWTVTADLSAWKALLADGTVKRVEIGVLPNLTVKGTMLALNAPSRTFNLGANKFDDKFYAPIIKIADGCNTCHDALGTTFHSASYGGNTVVCRLCHVTKAGGSHLEMQSRSLDSYVHAIHAGQAFDIGDIDFKDPAAAEEYALYSELPFPKHGITNCEACHVAGTYSVPTQAESLPGILSASDSVTTTTRSIDAMPSYVTGPATRVCGSCHRATLIKEDNAGELTVLNLHFRNGGYLVEAGKDPAATLQDVIKQIMPIFTK